ncbi:MAG: LodA/GoxA family CTQ-dependent oxidase [Acidobacteria bacterium]|nr:LodA/GoxA family CTQ-dependent oxidase [Acidobacteriota bacterium]
MTTLEIHPTIGIARLGSSEEFHFGPQPDIPLPASLRDGLGGLKRQAARFRLFECTRDASGRLTAAREVTAAEGSIEWRVQLMNRKAASANFIGHGMRNNATGDDLKDAALIIDAGARAIAGASTPALPLDAGGFRGKPVRLGDIRTDEAGRLIVCGGFGVSEAIPPQPDQNGLNFADNEGWHDDTSDGPIEAVFTPKGGPPREARPARVIVGPPDFAPEIENLTTLYDIAVQVAVDQGRLAPAAKPSFVRDIQPILRRAVDYQWVTKAAQGHAGNRTGNFAHDWAALADPGNPPAIAQSVLRRLRDVTQDPVPAPQEANERKWMPRLHDEHNDKNVLTLTRLQYDCLVKWSKGDFVGDLDQPPPPELLPDALDRAAMQSCSGGPFFPGIECGRSMKDPATWDFSEPYVPFRVNPALRPGEITGGNALPWQADFLACTWDPQLFLGWWPAQRPDHVFTEASPTVPKFWDRGIGGELGDDGMVLNWHKLGVVRRRAGAAGSTVFAEIERMLPG